MQLIPITTITPAGERAVEAETTLVEALERRGHLKLAALPGGVYDTDEYDAAVIAYRHARALAEDERNRWARYRPTTRSSVAYPGGYNRRAMLGPKGRQRERAAVRE